MSRLLEPIFGCSPVVAATDDRALLGALCEAEAALARACAAVGLIDVGIASEITAVCVEAGRAEPGDYGDRGVAGGNPVIPLVADLRERVGARAGTRAAAAVHLGATSQDIIDTALMLVSSRAIGIALTDFAAAAGACTRLAREHRATPMAARTLLQLAAPTTFGAVAAGWGEGLHRAARRLETARTELPVQLGGAAGTMSAFHPKGFEVLDAFADALELARPAAPWHTERTVVTSLAGALGTAAAAVAKAATDVVLLAQSEVAEVSEAAPGGSSALPHKRNPIAAVTARAAAAQAPGLVATVLAAAPELQRGAGPWHAEWPALLGLLRAVGGAAARLRVSLTGLRAHPDAMRHNLSLISEAVDITDNGHATDVVDRYLQGAGHARLA